MAGSLGDLGGLLRQAQQMQRQVQELQDELAKRHFEGVAGNGAVRAVFNGARELVSLKISAEAVDPTDLTLLEDLVAVAVREALRKAEEESAAAMRKVTGGLGLPGLR
jgi:hypothetical protein